MAWRWVPIAFLMLAVTGIAGMAAPGAARAQAAAAVVLEGKGVGARIVTPSTFQALPSGNFALLFLFDADPGENRLICERFLIAYKKSLAAKQPYRKLLYLPINLEQNTIDCGQASDQYDQSVYEDLARHPRTFLKHLGSDRSAYVVLLHHLPSGELVNAGYLMLTGRKQPDIDAQFHLFDFYYDQDDRCWVPELIREKGQIEKLADKVNIFDVHCDYR
jgi:hypothetical protein